MANYADFKNESVFYTCIWSNTRRILNVNDKCHSNVIQAGLTIEHRCKWETIICWKGIETTLKNADMY